MAEWLSIDFETYSLANLTRTGAARYAQDPSTRVMCMSYAFDAQPPCIWYPGLLFPGDVVNHVTRRQKVRAWGAGFEFWIWNETLYRRTAHVPPLTLAQLHCTMAQAAYWGLPLALEKAAEAAEMPIKKDMDGRRLILQMSRPRAIDPDGTVHWWHEEDPDKFRRAQLYCQRDVETERAMAVSLPPLPDMERQTWLLDQKINHNGMRLDVKLVERLKALSDEEKKRLDTELKGITNGEVSAVSQTAKLKEWLEKRITPVPDLQKSTVQRLCKTHEETLRLLPTPGQDLLDTHRVLQIRLEASKASVSKLKAMLGAVCDDGILRNLLQFYGAFRTGRWAGRLVQPQNFLRPTVENINTAIKDILSFQPGEDLVGYLLTFFGTPLDVAGSALRGCFIPRENHALLVFDYSQIEARVLAWLARQDDVLAVFASGKDIYAYAAYSIGSNKRLLGKVVTLACGYGMGVDRFRETAKIYGLDLSYQEAGDAVYDWRTANHKIVKYWYSVQRTCMHVISNNIKTPQKLGNRGTEVAMWRGHMLIKLPSGRTLIYRKAEIQNDPNSKKPRITYMGMNQYTRKWERLDTWGGKLVENITQAVARDVMVTGMKLVDLEPSITILLTVHDELIMETPKALADLTSKKAETILSGNISWAKDLPIECSGVIAERYGKF